MSKSRLTVVIKDDIQYTRLYNLEEVNVSAIFIKVKINKKKSLVIMCIYRQWALPSESGLNSDGLPGQLDRFDRVTSKLSDLSDKGNMVLIGGDVNIDLLPENDPLSRYSIRKLMEIYQEIFETNNLCQLNFKPTRYMTALTTSPPCPPLSASP